MGGLRSLQSGASKFWEEMRGASKRQLMQVRRQIGYISRHTTLTFLSARQNVQMALHDEYLQNTDGLVTDILNAVGLGESIIMQTVFRKDKSSGWRSLVPASHPKVVLADEPTFP